MANRLVKQGVTTYTPAVKEVIAQPARCVTTTTKELVTRWKTVTTTNGNSWSWYTVPITGYENVTRSVCYPAVEGVEGRDSSITFDNLQGWNAGARSVASVHGDLAAEFRFPPGTVGGLCGLCAGAARSFASITHGVYVTEDGLTVVEQGAQVALGPSVPEGTKLRITRAGEVVTYYIADWSYTSELPSAGTVNLAALLYVAGDSVDDPSIVPATFLQSTSEWGWFNSSEGGRLRARSPWGWGGRAVINDGHASVSFDVDGFGADYDYGYARLDIGGWTLEAESGFPHVEAAGIVTTVPMAMWAGGVSVGVGRAALEVDFRGAGYDYDYGTGFCDVGGVECYGVEVVEPTGAGSYTEAVAFIDTFTVDPVLFGHFSGTIQAGFTLDVVLAIDASYADFLVLGDEASATMVLEALIGAGVTLSDDPSAVARALLQYATNAETGAVTRYQGFDFKGFVSATGATYGWKRDGLYRLGADSDDGDLISAAIEFAAEDFETAERKRVSNLLMGLSTDGQVFVRLTDDAGVEVTYRAKQRMSEYRAATQQGRSSRYWRMRLELVDASFAELDNIEWVVGATGRRTTK